VYCEQFVGEAKNMLYRLKNRMNIAVPKLKSLQDIRFLEDGAIITVRSIFGQDFIEINAGRAGFPSCLIKLLDLPLAVPPMKWYAPGQETFTKGEGGWVITGPDGKTEVEGVDYIKTYFSWVTRDCPSCSPLEFTVAKGDDANILTGSSPNRPFWYKSENDDGSLIYNYEGAMVPHFMGYDWTVPPTPPNPLKHTIYSFWGCQAQIIKIGNAWSFSDAGGSYFLWKAYTEWSNAGPYVVDFTKTGLGYMLMQAFIKNEGINLCETKGTIIKVDCCLKPGEDRPAVIHWEKCIISEWCAAPDFDSMSVLAHFQVWSWILMGLKMSGDGCIPYEWTLSGMGKIVPSWGDRKFVTYVVPAWEFYERDCRATLFIEGKDRCGTSDSIFFKSCCDSGPAPMSIGYTSLLMSCGGSQTLTGSGGCGPCSWSLSGGGTLVPISPGSCQAIYTAPSTNPGCSGANGNPTITLTDCCGSSASLKLAVNCYTANETAYGEKQYTPTHSDCGWNWDCGGAYKCGVARSLYMYRCDGVYKGVNHQGNIGWKLCTGPCPNPCGFLPGDIFNLSTCTNFYEPWGCGDYEDQRTQAMKDAGCCPINPLTGLPY